MSYILEALEKSEKERKQKAVPDLHTQHTVYPGMKVPHEHRVKNTIRRYLPATFIVGAILASTWFLRHQIPLELQITITQPQSPKEYVAEQTAPAPEVLTSEADLASSGQNHGQQSQSIDSTATPPANAETEQQTTNETEALITSSRTAKSTELKENVILEPAPLVLSEDDSFLKSVTPVPLPFLDELPAPFRSELPSMTFAGHTYSTISEDRMIIINNSIRREGDPLAQGLRLEEITWDGVILNFREIQFQIVTTN